MVVLRRLFWLLPRIWERPLRQRWLLLRKHHRRIAAVWKIQRDPRAMGENSSNCWPYKKDRVVTLQKSRWFAQCRNFLWAKQHSARRFAQYHNFLWAKQRCFWFAQYNTSSFDLLNTAISFGPSNEQGNALIVQLSDPSPFNNGTGMKYTVKQSQSQSGVVSLEESSVKNNGDLMDNSCSLFIDGLVPSGASGISFG